MLYRLIPPKWLLNKPIMEGEFTGEQINQYNKEGYNVYYLPNHPKVYVKGTTVDGTHIDAWDWVMCDFDLKDKAYPSKDAFIEALLESRVTPTTIVDSGNGIHAYWKVSNLDPMSYLRFCRRLIRRFNTDDTIATLYRLMRTPGTINTKVKDKPVECFLLTDTGTEYTCEELDKLLPPITVDDEKYCIDHYERTHNINQTVVDDTLPPKFGKLLRDSSEVKDIWTGDSDDRSKSDYRLGHLMFANGFAKEEAASVLVNSAKALQRAPVHRQSYATNIVDKIWTFELTDNKDLLDLSSSVKDILKRSGTTLKGTRFKCHRRIDNTKHGYRLGHVLGLVAGSGVGKTAFTLNKFRWFAQENPDYHHFFIPLEEPGNSIADRWHKMCGNDTSLHDKVHILSNYNEDGSFRHLAFDDIREYIEKFQRVTGNKVGCIVIDHIGALKKKGKDGENQDLMDICHAMKAFAVQTNTFLIMQSQSSREKAGIGDLELNKDAAYGTVYFESYCDYLVTLWQPVKRCHSEQACPTVTAFKFCKIRHKNTKHDIIQEDVPYYMFFDSDTEQMRDMSQDEKTSFDFFLPKATNKRKADRKTELVQYQSVLYKESDAATTDSNRHD